MSAPPASLLGSALAAHDADLCVVPPKQDGSKMPAGAWRPYQSRRPTLDELHGWYADGERTGIGYICGAVSGGLELFEFDCRRTYAAFKATADELGMGDLVARIEGGYASATPGGGVHWLTRCATISGNTKLAERPKRDDEKKHPKDNRQVLIETRGEGGYTVEAPSSGTVHPTGNPYRLVSGSVETIATMTADERRRLWALARTFDEMPEDAPAPTTTEPAKHEARPTGSGPTVIEDFNARATWRDVLQPHGWTPVCARGDLTFWRRPGKDRYWSATTNYGGSDRLCVFSSSTPFKVTTTAGSKAGYSRFGAYAVLNHADDAKAAVRELGQRGYGPKLPRIVLDDEGGAGWFSPRSRASRRMRVAAPSFAFNETDLAVARASLNGFARTPWTPPAREPAVATAPAVVADVPTRTLTIVAGSACPLCGGPGKAGGRACAACMAG